MTDISESDIISSEQSSMDAVEHKDLHIYLVLDFDISNSQVTKSSPVSQCDHVPVQFYSLAQFILHCVL